jgi:hypothetical protein
VGLGPRTFAWHCHSFVRQQRRILSHSNTILLGLNIGYRCASSSLNMSPHTESLSHRFETPPVTASPHQEHLKRSHSNPNLPPEDHRSQDDMSSAHPQHLERPSSAQNLQSQGHQPQHIPFNKPSQLDSWSQRLGEKTVKQFEELARNFTEQETIEDIINWNKYLREQLKDEYLIAEYNAWSEEYLKPQPRMDSLWWKDLATGFTKFKFCLQLADWNADWNFDNKLIDFVFSTMLYCRRLRNRGLLMLGTFQRSWLTLRLHMWAISAQKTDPQLRELHGVADSQPGGVLGLRYKPIGKKSTAKVLFFFPLGMEISSESRLPADHHRIYPPHRSLEKR